MLLSSVFLYKSIKMDEKDWVQHPNSHGSRVGLHLIKYAPVQEGVKGGYTNE